jgi:hypothetical protein
MGTEYVRIRREALEPFCQQVFQSLDLSDLRSDPQEFRRDMDRMLRGLRKVAYSPGCGSASEISYAEELGVEIVKIFPGKSVGGPDFVKAVLGPCSWTRIMPTGGVDATEESIKAWFKADVACVGMGSRLIRKDLVAAGNWSEITAKVRQVLAWIKEAREEQALVFPG